jgi:hypothetical protein
MFGAAKILCCRKKRVAGSDGPAETIRCVAAASASRSVWRHLAPVKQQRLERPGPEGLRNLVRRPRRAGNLSAICHACQSQRRAPSIRPRSEEIVFISLPYQSLSGRQTLAAAHSSRTHIVICLAAIVRSPIFACERPVIKQSRQRPHRRAAHQRRRRRQARRAQRPGLRRHRRIAGRDQHVAEEPVAARCA